MQPQEQPVVKIGQLEIRYLIDGTVTGAGMGMFELTVPPGARVPPAHSHRDNEEIVYVLEGTLRYTVDDETRDLRRGRAHVHAARFGPCLQQSPRPPGPGAHHPDAGHRRAVFPRRRRGRHGAGRPEPGEDGRGDDPLRPRPGAAEGKLGRAAGLSDPGCSRYSRHSAARASTASASFSSKLRAAMNCR